MAPRNHQPTIPPRNSRDHLRGASRISPTAEDEQAANVINNAIRRSRQAEMTPKPTPSSKSWTFFGNLFGRTGDSKSTPVGLGGNEEEKDENDEEEGDELGDGDGDGEGEGEMGIQNNGMGNETEISQGDPQPPSAQLQVSQIYLPKRQLRSQFALPHQKPLAKQGRAAKKTHNQIPVNKFSGRVEGSDNELPEEPVGARTRAASRMPSLRAAPKASQPAKPKAKRKHQEEVRDIFDLPDDGPEGASTNARPANKRAKILVKPSVTLQSPKRTTRTETNRLPETSVRRSIEVVLPSKSMPKKSGRRPNLQPVAQPVRSSLTPEADEDSPQVEESLFVSPGPDVESNQGDVTFVDDENQNQDQEDGDQPTAKSVQEDQEEDDEEEDQESEEENSPGYDGITEIVMDPSPVKPLRQETIQPRIRIGSRASSRVPSQITDRAPSRSSQAKSRPTSTAAANLKRSFASSSAGGTHQSDDDSSEDESIAASDKSDEESRDDDPNDEDALFKLETLKRMYKTVRQVGKTWNSEKAQFTTKESLTDPETDLCTNIFDVLKRLVLSYEEGDPELEETATAIKEELADLKESIKEVIEQVLCNMERDDESQKTLKDLYFCIMPELVHTMLLAAEAYGLSRDIPQPHLKEVSKLSGCLKNLAEETLKHSTSPRADGTKAARSPYRFSKPTRDIINDIRAIYTSLAAEQSFRQQEKKRKERDRKMALGAKARKEQQDRDNRDRKLREEEFLRKQKESLREGMRDPVVKKLVTAELERVRARSGQRQSSANSGGRQRSSNSGGRRRVTRSSSPVDEDDDNAPQGEEEESEDDNDLEEPERVSVFGQNNNRQEQGPKPWTNSEKATFIDILRDENEPHLKYQRTARELDRSMDDVLSMAKELQAVMDHEHSQGRLNLMGDVWTYHIWRPRDES